MKYTEGTAHPNWHPSDARKKSSNINHERSGGVCKVNNRDLNHCSEGRDNDYYQEQKLKFPQRYIDAYIPKR